MIFYYNFTEINNKNFFNMDIDKILENYGEIRKLMDQTIKVALDEYAKKKGFKNFADLDEFIDKANNFLELLDDLHYKKKQIKEDEDIFIDEIENEIKDDKDEDDFITSQYYQNENYDDWEAITFDALTDGQYGDWEDFNGSIDDAKELMGY